MTKNNYKITILLRFKCELMMTDTMIPKSANNHSHGSQRTSFARLPTQDHFPTCRFFAMSDTAL